MDSQFQIIAQWSIATGKKSFLILLRTPLQALEGCFKVCPEPPLLRAEELQLF